MVDNLSLKFSMLPCVTRKQLFAVTTEPNADALALLAH